MEIKWIEAFVALADEHHFGRAAGRVGVGQSGFSQMIRKLEAEVGTSLFERSTRAVAITPAGEAMLPYAKRMLWELRSATGAALSSDHEVRGTLSLGFAGIDGLNIIPRFIRELRARHPRLRLDLHSPMVTGVSIARVKEGSLDFAFVGLEAPPEDLAHMVIGRERVGVVLPLDHRLAREELVDVSALADETFIAAPAQGGSAIQNVARAAVSRAGFEPIIGEETNDPSVRLTLVAAGLGVSFAMMSSQRLLPPGAVIIPVEPALFFNHAVVWASENPPPSVLAAVSALEHLVPGAGRGDPIPE